MVSESQQSGMQNLPFVAGTVFGAASFLVGILLTLIVAVTDLIGALSDLSVFELSGEIYYNAQLVDIEREYDGTAGTESWSHLGDDSFVSLLLDFPSLIYHLVPIIVLIGAGYALSRYVGARGSKQGMITGAMLIPGTTGMALVGRFLLSETTETVRGTETVAPDILGSILLVGIVFPAIFGAIGGRFAAVRHQDDQARGGGRTMTRGDDSQTAHSTPQRGSPRNHSGQQQMLEQSGQSQQSGGQQPSHDSQQPSNGGQQPPRREQDPASHHQQAPQTQGGGAQQPTQRGARGPQGPPSQQRGQPPNARGGRGDLLERLPLKAALVIGVAVFFVGIGLQVALLGVDGSLNEDASADELFETGDDEGAHDLVSAWAYFYYNAHFAEIEGEENGETESVDFIGDADSEEMELPSVAFRFAPIIVLIGGGYVLASRTQRRVGERLNPMVAGASIVVGYGLMAVLGIALFSVSFTGTFGSEVQIAPAAGDAILLPGLTYPLLFGAIGGFLAGR